MKNIMSISVLNSFTINKVHPHLDICQIFLYTLPSLISADACLMHRDPSNTKEASRHPLTTPGLMMAPLPNIEEP